MSKAILTTYQYTGQMSTDYKVKSMKLKQQHGDKVLHCCKMDVVKSCLGEKEGQDCIIFT